MLIEYDDNFLNTDLETIIFDRIIDSISNIENEHFSLRKN